MDRTGNISLSFETERGGDFTEWQRKVRRKLVELTGLERLPEAKAYDIVDVIERGNDGLLSKKIILHSDRWETQPVYSFEPRNVNTWNGVTLVAFHGHGTDPFGGIYTYIQDLARIGYRVLTPILYGKMERNTKRGQKDSDYNPRQVCAAWALETDAIGTTLLGVRLYDALLAYHLALNCEGTEPNRIACIGLSMGGELSLYLAALEPGISCCVCAGFFSSFGSLLLEKNNCLCYSIRGWSSYFDMPDIAGCVAPRPLQIQMGDHDPCFNHRDVRDSFEYLETIYQTAGAARNRLQYVNYPGTHCLNKHLAVAFLKEHIPHRV